MNAGAELPRAAVVQLPDADNPFLVLGCAPCGLEIRLALTQEGVEQGHAFLREHGPCLADRRL